MATHDEQLAQDDQRIHDERQAAIDDVVRARGPRGGGDCDRTEPSDGIA